MTAPSHTWRDDADRDKKSLRAEVERLRGALREIARHGSACDCGPQRAYRIASGALEAKASVHP